MSLQRGRRIQQLALCRRLKRRNSETAFVSFEDHRLRHLLELKSIDPSQLEIVESIAEGGQAHVSLAKYTRWPGASKEDVVVKRYKGRLGVRAVHELRRRKNYLKSRMRSNMQDDDATQMMMMPFSYDLTLHIMHFIAFGMHNLCERGIIHRDLKGPVRKSHMATRGKLNYLPSQVFCNEGQTTILVEMWEKMSEKLNLWKDEEIKR